MVVENRLGRGVLDGRGAAATSLESRKFSSRKAFMAVRSNKQMTISVFTRNPA